MRRGPGKRTHMVPLMRKAECKREVGVFSAACIEAGQEGRLAGHRSVGSVCSAQQVPGECVRTPGLEVTICPEGIAGSAQSLRELPAGKETLAEQP